MTIRHSAQMDRIYNGIILMSSFKDPYHRRSIRLPGYDYSQAGAYFVTIVKYNRENLFGIIQDGEMIINPFGEIIANEWLKTTTVRPNVELGEFIIMPNHVHGIIIIRDPVGAMRRIAPTPKGAARGSIGAILGQIKSITAKRINTLRGTPGISVWQRNYYEHIIRSNDEWDRIGAYIRANPTNWEIDRENLK